MPRRTTVLIEVEKWRLLVAETLRRFPLETGGILMGSWLSDKHLLVTDVIGPGPCARHETMSFDPDQAWQEHEVDLVWRSRDGVAYLGDWHSHPDGGTRASNDDRLAAMRIARSPAARAPSPIMLVIAAASNGTLTPQPYLLSRHRLVKAIFRLATSASEGEQER